MHKTPSDDDYFAFQKTKWAFTDRNSKPLCPRNLHENEIQAISKTRTETEKGRDRDRQRERERIAISARQFAILSIACDLNSLFMSFVLLLEK